MTPSTPAGADGTTPFGRTIDYSKCWPNRWPLDAHELIWLASSDPDNEVTRFPSSSVHRYLFRTPLIRWQRFHRRQFDLAGGNHGERLPHKSIDQSPLSAHTLAFFRTQTHLFSIFCSNAFRRPRKGASSGHNCG